MEDFNRKPKKVKSLKPRPTSWPEPTKNIFEIFLFTKTSFNMPVFTKTATNPKNSRQFSFDAEFIAVFRTMFMNMYQNRIKPEYDYLETCHLSFSQIAKLSRVSKDIVYRAIQYGLMVGFFEQVPTKLKAKCKYIIGHFNYKNLPTFCE